MSFFSCNRRAIPQNSHHVGIPPCRHPMTSRGGEVGELLRAGRRPICAATIVAATAARRRRHRCHGVAISKARAGQQCRQFVAGPSAALPSLSSPSIERELANSAIRCHLRCCQASERKPTMPPQHCLLLRCCHHRALLTALPLSLLSAPISERESTMPTRHCHRHCAPSLLLSSIK